MRILRLLARQRRHELDDHNAAERTGQHPSAGRRRHLERAATLMTARVAAAEARRSFRRADRVS